jgi:GH15 family glucan-1,4-alpha-glucosidase
MSEPIENHGIIGDMRTVALVNLKGTIDFMCWPRFDSPSIFLSLLDDRAGSFELAPVGAEWRARQQYLPDTNVLLTRFLSTQGVAEICDFMSVGSGTGCQRLIRQIKAIRKPLKVRMKCAPAFDYARCAHEAVGERDSVLFSPHDPAQAALRVTSQISLKIDNGAAIAEFQLPVGQSAVFILEAAAAYKDDDPACVPLVASLLKTTSEYWRQWVALSNYSGRWSDVVHRSALVLKLLTSGEYGSMVAAPTFGLPEVIGGDRNWDYRYTWMRDAAFTVYAFLRLGYTAEAYAFKRWLGERVSQLDKSGAIAIMYRVDGTSELAENTLPHLAGYSQSSPVRIGNAASAQLQLDIYGALMDAVYLSDRSGKQLTWQEWEGISRRMEWIIAHWQEPDEGIWEMRNGRKHWLQSRVMCWVALDRGLRLARHRGLPARLLEWTQARDEIFRSVHADFWNPRLNAFVQSAGADSVDASCLLMPLVRFISPTDPRWLSTLKLVGERLLDDSLVYRYVADGGDGLQGTEGTFNMCSFWYIECLARAGDVLRARFLFDKMLGYANHLGLYAEQTGPAGEHLGNFPQAFTHLALISAALCLERLL